MAKTVGLIKVGTLVCMCVYTNVCTFQIQLIGQVQCINDLINGRGKWDLEKLKI